MVGYRSYSLQLIILIIPSDPKEVERLRRRREPALLDRLGRDSSSAVKSSAAAIITCLAPLTAAAAVTSLASDDPDPLAAGTAAPAILAGDVLGEAISLGLKFY